MGLAWLVKAVGPLTDVQELLLSAKEGSILVFVEHPHPLGRVQWRTTPEGDNRVGLKGLHQSNPFFNRLGRWVSFDVREDQVLNIILPQLQLINYDINVAVRVNRWARNNEDPVDVWHVLEVTNGVAFKVNSW